MYVSVYIYLSMYLYIFMLVCLFVPNDPRVVEAGGVPEAADATLRDNLFRLER